MKSNMSSRVMAAGIAALWCLRAGLAVAQTPSLVELAQKEQERRKAMKGSAAKVYSDKDLPKSGTPAVASSAPATAPAVIADEKPAETKSADQKDETWWRTRITQAREAQRRA